MRPLLQAYPKLSDTIQHLAICDLPTPIEHLSKVGDYLKHPALYIKRDDLTAKVYGGQKVRTIEFLLANAHSDGGNVVAGMIAASMALASNIYAQQQKIPLKTIVFKQTMTKEALTNLRYFQYVGADIISHEESFQGMEQAVEEFKQKAQAQFNHDGFVLNPNAPLGMLGYLNAAYELKQQIDAGVIPEPDYIYISSGMLGTSAGIITGLKALGMKTKLIPCNVNHPFRPLEAQYQMVKDLGKQLIAFLREHTDNAFPDISITDEDIHFHSIQASDLQEKHTEIESWIPRMQDLEGIQLDMMWTARVWHQLEEDSRAGVLDDQVILYWHTMNSRSYPDAIYEQDYHDLPEALWRYFEVENFALINRPDF